MFERLTNSGAIALIASVTAAAIVIVYLLRRPAFTLAAQLWLLLGLGVLPLITAAFGNAAGFEATKSVQFCGSCHVMLAHTGDALDLHSQSLAARHSRNAAFGEASCYTCHEDYGLFGAVFTKLNGMQHVYHYVRRFRKLTLDQALLELHLYKPLPNGNCMHCHTTTTRLWLDVNDHVSALSDVRSGKLSCASDGCHGYAHPFTKAAQKSNAHEEQAR